METAREKALNHDGKSENYHSEIIETSKKIKDLIEVGFEYVCEKDGRYSSQNASRPSKNMKARENMRVIADPHSRSDISRNPHFCLKF